MTPIRRGPRLTEAKLGRWRKAAEKVLLEQQRLMQDVEASLLNPKAKHYADLTQLRSDLFVSCMRAEYVLASLRRLRP